MVKDLTGMVQEAAVAQEHKCETTGFFWQQMVETGGFSEKAKVPCQRLLKIRGSLNFVVRTYDWMTP